MEQFRAMFITSIIGTVIAGISWSIAIAGIWVPLGERALAVSLAVAVAVTPLAGALWLVSALRDRDKDALVHALADLTLRRARAVTQPLKRVV